ncbi:MAG TPA: hypothetical protein DDZ51_25550, partial [Planctomycetaceae bacterium]|nr:hypothetical protein [Planctomycetaceae bacterium]
MKRQWAILVVIINKESGWGSVGKSCLAVLLRMNPFPCFAKITSLFVVVSLTAVWTAVWTAACLGQDERATGGETPDKTAIPQRVAEDIIEERREFQLQELMLAKSGGWIFKSGETPRLLWRDVETVRRLGCDEPLKVRWFNSELEELSEPNASGRWLAWIEGAAPNGTPLRRLRTFYALPEQIPVSNISDLKVVIPNLSSANMPAVV